MSRRRYADHSSSITFLGAEKLSSQISSLFHQIQNFNLQESHFRTFHLYWKIGRLISEYEQQQAIKEGDRPELLFQLSEQLAKEFDNQFVGSVLVESRRFYLLYPSAFKPQRGQNERGDGGSRHQAPLTWDHYRLLIYVSCPKARSFYEKEVSNSNWSFPLLERFIKSRVFERLSTSTTKESVLRSVQQGSLALFSVNRSYLDKLMHK